jgi:hypothetical protein
MWEPEFTEIKLMRCGEGLEVGGQMGDFPQNSMLSECQGCVKQCLSFKLCCALSWMSGNYADEAASLGYPLLCLMEFTLNDLNLPVL